MKDFFIKTKKNICTYCKNNVLFLTFLITSILNEVLLRFFSVKNHLEIKPLLADVAIVLIVGAFGYFFKPKNRFKYYFTWAFIFTLICFINSIYYNNFLSFASFSMLATSLQAVSVADAIVQNVMELKDFIYILQLVILIVVHSGLKKKNYYENINQNGKVMALNTMVMGVIALGFFISTLTNLDIGRFGKQWNREYVAMKFGTYLYQFNDIVISLKPQISPLFGYDEHAKEFREYYGNRDYSHKDNKYTNIFEGKNLIVIHAESIQKFTMDTKFNGEEVTPNLNKLASEGMYFTNFYAQDSVGTSSDTEFTFNTSLMPSSSGTVFVNYWDREYITIPNLLNEKGYYTFSMHGNNCTMWNRNVVHESFGYNKFYCYNKDFDIDEKLGLGLSDKSFFKQAVPKLEKINNEYNNFYGVMIMLTNHTPFDAYSVVDFDVDYKYEKLNEETGEMEIISAPYMEDTVLGKYFKTVHYADEAIGQFINDLDESGLLENTVIVIYGDHDAKIKKSEFNRFYNYDPYTDSIIDKNDPNYITIDSDFYEINRKVPFIIWTKDKKLQNVINTKVDKVMGMYDAMPTLGNMFNFSSKYSLGHDIFDIDENIVVFPDGDWLTDKLYYHSQKEAWKLLNPDEVISLDYIESGNKYAEEIISISNSIITYDLIKKTKEVSEMINNGED